MTKTHLSESLLLLHSLLDGSFWKKLLHLGPGLMVAVGYMDLGKLGNRYCRWFTIWLYFIIVISFIQYFLPLSFNIYLKTGNCSRKRLSTSLQRHFFSDGKFYIMGFMRNYHYCLWFSRSYLFSNCFKFTFWNSLPVGIFLITGIDVLLISDASI